MKTTTKKIQSITLTTKLDIENFLLNSCGNPLQTTSKYKGASSQDLINCLESNGYMIREIQAPRYWKVENAAFNKHIIRLCKKTDYEAYLRKEIEEIPEIVIVNNNNNRGKIIVLVGIYRFICQNGMFMGETFFSMKIRHDKNIARKLLYAIQEADQSYHRVVAMVTKMKSIEIDTTELMRYRAEVINPIIKNSVTSETTKNFRVLGGQFQPKREEDAKKDLWTVFNVHQEQILRNGVSYQKVDEQKDGTLKIVNNTTREIKSIDKKIEINQALLDRTLEHFNIAA